MNWHRLPHFLIACCASGLLWQLPTNLLLFIPVAAFWLIVAGAIGLILGSVLHERYLDD